MRNKIWRSAAVLIAAVAFVACKETTTVGPIPETPPPVGPIPETPPPVGPIPETPPPVGPELETAVQQAYEQEFGEVIPRPAIYNDTRSVDCLGNTRLTTTAYLGERDLIYLYLSRDGTTVNYKRDELVSFPPAGTFRVLTVWIDHAETTGGRLALWEAAQADINRHHAEFATSRGFASPIVVFESVNVTIEASQIDDPRIEESVISAAESHGISAQGFDIVMSINIDPDASEGGFAGGTFVYVGNYSGWQAPLTAADMTSIAKTAYHHEVGHLWGWAHEWAPSCGGTDLGFDPFIAPPTLFGWEDTDGDGVPEILDTTPYGRSQP